MADGSAKQPTPWIRVFVGNAEETDYLPVPGGRIYRTRTMGKGEGVAMVFVPDAAYEKIDFSRPEELVGRA